MSAPRLSETEQDALAERMRNALWEIGAGQRPADVALAVMRAAGALLRGCASPGNEVALLGAGICSLEAEIDLVRAGLAPDPVRQH